MYKKILFLDFDGVMLPYKNNNLNSVAAKLELLDLIIDRSDVNVIIHSSSKHEIRDTILSSTLRNKDKIIGITLDNHVIKGGQIRNTIKEYNIKNYLVIDDDDTYICSDKYNYIDKSNFYHIDRNIGLTKSDVERIVSIINNF